MSKMDEQIRAAARKYLAEAVVSCVIGYEADPRGRVRPAFIEEPEDADRLIWNTACNLNLVNYLHQRKLPPGKEQPAPQTAVIVRPCDVRSVNLLIAEQQIKRENIKLIGITCPGTELAGQQRLACNFCQERTPVDWDVLIDGDEPVQIPSGEDIYEDIQEMENRAPAERLAFWKEEFDRCLRCYACRLACPGCYCFECVSEQVDPRWTSIAITVPEKMFFHLMRAYHLAGRCVDCGACEAVCPVDIPLSKLNRKVASEVLAMFNYKTGDDPGKAPLLACFDPHERLTP